MLTTPSSPRANSVSLKPQPLCLNHCSLFLMDYPDLMQSGEMELAILDNLFIIIFIQLMELFNNALMTEYMQICGIQIILDIFGLLMHKSAHYTQSSLYFTSSICIFAFIIILKIFMGAIVAFFTKLNEKSNPQRSKQQHLINIANLNYCGIMKSPFEFYAGKFQKDLQQLSKIFQNLRPLYVPLEQGKAFSWQFSKLDKKIKDRYCPFYDIKAGIQNNKFLPKARFIQKWQTKMAEQQILTQSKFSEAQKSEALKFDLLAFHSLLFKVYKILNIDEAVNLNVEPYLKEYQPYFAQSFLDQKRKLDQFKKGLEESFADIVFVQQPDQLLIDDIQKFQAHFFLAKSADKDTIIFAKKMRFGLKHDPEPLLQRLTPQEHKLLNWNGHTSIMFLDNYMLISGHLNSKKAENEADVRDLVKIMPIVVQKYYDFEIICGMDANSFIAPFDPRLHMFPDKEEQFTSIKKRTSMQVQSSKSEKLVKQLKDAIMTTLPMEAKHVFTISGNEPAENLFLPLDQHPFDHFLVFAIVNEKRK